MDKFKVIEEIESYLREELSTAKSHGGSAENVAELERLLVMYRFLPRRIYGREDVVIPSALVELKLGETIAYYFIAPQGGGLVTSVEGRPVQIITPQSPLGEKLLGKKAGEEVEVPLRSGVRTYQIVSVT